MGTSAPLRIPSFRRLLASYSLNELGDVFGVIALSILVFDRTQDPLATTALFVTARFLPAFIAPALTARLDQLAVGSTLGVLYVVEALCFLALAALVERFSLAAVLALALLDGVLAVTGRGLTRGAIAATLPTDALLRTGNGLVNVGFAVSTIGGAVLAAGVVAEIGVRAALLADAASFALVAGLMLACRDLPAAAEARTPFRQRLTEGLAHVRRTPLLRALLGVQALALVLFTLVVPVEVVYAKETLGAGDIGLGVLMASWGAGMLVGSAVFVLSARVAPLIMVPAATALVGAGYLGMGLVETLLAAGLFSVLGGIGNGMQWVSVMTLLQERTPLALQARIAGLLESLGAAMPGLGFLLGGLLTAATDAGTTYLISGVCVLGLVLVASVVIAVRWRLTPRPRPAAPSDGA